jgi:lysophospholipase L1-like esterase
MRTALTEYESNVRALLRMVRGEYSLFISSFPVCVDRTGVRTDTLKAYMDVAISVARDFDYDVWDLFGELAGKNIDHYLADDGLHFNDQGHAMIAGEVQSKGDFVNALSLR